jgi:uncharacterized SAM-dependent methyltransferase
MNLKNDTPVHGVVVDIGGSNMYDNVAERLEEALMTPSSLTNKPTLPDELLYDDVGLPIWNQIIFTPEFYQTHDEIALFDKHGADVAARCQAGVTIVDLGAGLVHPLLPPHPAHPSCVAPVSLPCPN